MARVSPFIMSLALLQGLGASAACRCDRGAGELAVLEWERARSDDQSEILWQG